MVRKSLTARYSATPEEEINSMSLPVSGAIRPHVLHIWLLPKEEDSPPCAPAAKRENLEVIYAHSAVRVDWL